MYLWSFILIADTTSFPTFYNSSKYSLCMAIFRFKQTVPVSSHWLAASISIHVWGTFRGFYGCIGKTEIVDFCFCGIHVTHD